MRVGLASPIPARRKDKTMSYRDYLNRKGVQPLVIERTAKRAGDFVLDSWARPGRILPPRYRERDSAGRFRRVMGDR